MRKLLCLALCLIFCLFFVSCDKPQQTEIDGKDNNKIVVYNWGEYIANGEDGMIDVIEEFTKETGIEVTYLTFSNNEEMYTKIKSGSASYDVVIPSDYMISKMIKEDMLQPLNFDNIPNYQYIDKELVKKFDYDPDNLYSVPYTWGRVGLLYNTDVVKEDIDSWAALWDEKYENKILMFDNSRDAFGIAQKRLGYSFNSLNEQEWREAAELLKEQKPVVRSYVMDQIFTMMLSGEAAIAPYYIGDALTIMDQSEDGNIDFVVPKEGTNLFVDAMCVPTSAKNKAGAEAFINYMCSYEPAKANAEYICYSSPQVQVMEWHKEYLAENYGDWAVEATYPSAEELAEAEVFMELSPEINKLQTDLWLEVRTSSHYTSSIICVSVVMLLLILYVVITRIRKYRKDKFIYS